jgi:hypothetical protein
LQRVLILTAMLLILPISGHAEDYWQQRTHYRIDAVFLPDSNEIAGTSELRYWNNSPDTLRQVFFHLYYNADRPGSYRDKLWRREGYYGVANADSSEWGRMEIDSLCIAGTPVDLHKTRFDNTIWEIPLAASLMPHDSLDFRVVYRCQIPKSGWRNGAKGEHYDVAQWYPRIAVYDRDGWHAYQHLDNGEFYADFGDYDVTLRAPRKFHIAHTGLLVNEAELFPGLPQGSRDTILTDILAQKKEDKDTTKSPDSLRAFGGTVQHEAAPAADSAKSEDTSSTRTWVMHAERVIDFAWGTDPKFIWDRTRTDSGVIIDCIYTPQAKKHWQKNGAEFTRFCIELYSRKFGQYPYPRFTLVAGNISGGVEYPMLTFMGQGLSHMPRYSLFSITAHEVAHNWFYGLVASDEIRQPFMDEGFTDFATCVAHEAYFGRWGNSYAHRTHTDSLFSDPDDERTANQRSYVRLRSRIDDEPPLATSADKWTVGMYYHTLIYRKTATVLYALMDVLGEDKFWECMHHYFDSWQFRHPGREDMYLCFNQCAGQNLEWFWEQWFEQNWTLDYELKSVHSVQTDSGCAVEATVQRHGEAVMPATLRFELSNGAHIDRKLSLEPWLAAETEHTYLLSLPLGRDGSVNRVVLDPELYLPDLNRTNNTTGILPVQVRFAPPEAIYPNRRVSLPLDHHRIEHQPRLWYNEIDGVDLGYCADLSWLDLAHKWNAETSIGTESGVIDWQVGHDEIWEGLSRRTHWGLQQRRRDGRWDVEVFAQHALSSSFFDTNEVRLSIRAGDVNHGFRDYLHAQSPWSDGRWTEIELRYRRPMERRYHAHSFTGVVRTSVFESDFDYRQLEAGFASRWRLLHAPVFQTRLYVSMFGGDPPLQRRPSLGTASGATYFEDPYYRAQGTLPARGFTDAHLFLPGGGDLHGYVDRLAYPDNMAALNVLHEAGLPEILVPGGIPIVTRNLSAIDVGIFGDAGFFWNNEQKLIDGKGLGNAGLTLAYDMPYRLIERLLGDRKIRAYFPIWVSDPVPGEDNLEFRWLLTYSRRW